MAGESLDDRISPESLETAAAGGLGFHTNGGHE